MTKSYAGPGQFVRVDLARRRSVITRMDAEGAEVEELGRGPGQTQA